MNVEILPNPQTGGTDVLIRLSGRHVACAGIYEAAIEALMESASVEAEAVRLRSVEKESTLQEAAREVRRTATGRLSLCESGTLSVCDTGALSLQPNEAER